MGTFKIIINVVIVSMFFINVFYTVSTAITKIHKCKKCPRKEKNKCPGYMRPFSIYRPSICFLTLEEKERIKSKIKELD